LHQLQIITPEHHIGNFLLPRAHNKGQSDFAIALPLPHAAAISVAVFGSQV
jgi:hypothetical protein